jgi:hypothetical protein
MGVRVPPWAPSLEGDGLQGTDREQIGQQMPLQCAKTADSGVAYT